MSPMRVCSIISPHRHPKGAEGTTVIVHDVAALQDPGQDGDEPDDETEADEE